MSIQKEDTYIQEHLYSDKYTENSNFSVQMLTASTANSQGIHKPLNYQEYLYSAFQKNKSSKQLTKKIN